MQADERRGMNAGGTQVATDSMAGVPVLKCRKLPVSAVARF
jgi:hypothetical protein